MSTLVSPPSARPSVPPRTPLRERVNLRIVGFVAIFALLLGFPLYAYLDAAISGGLKNRGDHYEVDLKAMSTFPFDQRDGQLADVPKQWRDLDGKTVLMEGEIAPGTQATNAIGGQFDLVYSVSKCCVGGPPQIQHFVKVAVPQSARVELNHDGPVRVRGKLRVDVTRDEAGNVNGVYHVVAEGVSSV